MSIPAWNARAGASGVGTGSPGGGAGGGGGGSDDKFFQDRHIVTAPGEQVFDLTYLPATHSEHLYWHPAGLGGIYQEGDLWSRVDKTITVPDTEGDLQIDDVLVVEYKRVSGQAEVVPPPPDPEPDPDPGATLIFPTNEVNLSDAVDFEGSIVGAAPQWGDNDVSSGSIMRSRYGTGVGNRYQQVNSLVDAQPGLVVDPDARVAVWWKETFNSHPYGVRSYLRRFEGTENRLTYSPTGSNGLLAPEGWLVRELIPVAGRTIEGVLTEWLTNDMFLVFWPGAASPDPSGSFTSEIRIGEARIAIYYP